MTEEQRQKYEKQAAFQYDFDTPRYHAACWGICHAHPIAHSEGWNEAIEKAIKISENRQDESTDNAEYLGHLKVIEELKKLKR